MTPSDTNDSKCEVNAIGRKKFLLATGAAAGAATLFGSAPRAYATDTNYAYWDAVQTFSADQYFGNITAGMSTSTGQVYFKSGQPWVDVKAFGAVGDGSTADDVAINTAISTAIGAAVNGQGTLDNPIIYFPPGQYLINNPIILANSTSNFCLMGAGYQSSTLNWGPSAPANSAMLQLNNAYQVHIKDLGFIGRTGSNMPAYGIQVGTFAGQVGGIGAGLTFIERVFIGGLAGPGPYVDKAIAFTSDSQADDVDNGPCLFRDVSIQYVKTGYWFGTTNDVDHNIIGGSIQNCLTVAIDNTPGPNNAQAANGGSYCVFGTRFAGNALTLQVSQTTGETIDLVGIHAGTPSNPEGALLATGTMDIQNITFIGGDAILSNPGSGNSVLFNASRGILEFQGFSLATIGGTGAALNFPGTGTVNFYGGTIQAKTCFYNGSLRFHGTTPGGVTTVFSTPPGNMTAYLAQFGSNNHIAGSNASSGYSGPGGALGSGGSIISVTGVDLGGVITVETAPSGGLGFGGIVEVNFSSLFSVPPQLLLSPANAAAAGVMDIVYAQTFTGYALINTSKPLVNNTTYVWNYFLIG